MKDIITDESNDLSFENGDFKISEADSQHIEHIVLTDKGQFRSSPLLGVGVARYFHGSGATQALKQDIRTNLVSDGYTVKKIDVDGAFNVAIDAKRKLSTQ